MSENKGSIEGQFSLAAFPEKAERDWQEFKKSYKKKLSSDFDIQKLGVSQLKNIFGNSSFLASFMIRHPELMDALLSSPYLFQEKSLNIFQSEIAQIEKDEKDWIIKFKLYKYQELLRITMKDLHDPKNDREILRELSYLAKTIIYAIDARVFSESVSKWGQPQNTDQSDCRYCIVALGKLGGDELNYSSDVDPIFVIESDGGVTAQSFSNHEFFVRHVQKLTQALQSYDAEGFFYRMDWDLRPEGKAGTLVNSLQALENYYSVFGQDWERQALSKASFLAGDFDFFQEFESFKNSFVFHPILDVDYIESIRLMKEKINQQYQVQDKKSYNVKLGSGGIREVEFYVQSLLLLYAPKDPRLRLASTLALLDALEKYNYLDTHIYHDLKESYLFLRRVEHRLQLVEEAQTHSLSDDVDSQIQLARRMHYHDSDIEKARQAFIADLHLATAKIHQHYQDLFTLPITSSDFVRSQHCSFIHEKINGVEPLEEKVEQLRVAKQELFEEVAKLENHKSPNRKKICHELSLIAQAVCQETLDLALNELQKKYGRPSYKKYGEGEGHSHLIVLAMGKLGAFELGYNSDLDLVFLFTEHGMTDGNKSISNMEFFARVVQKFIFFLSVTTQYGRAYEIDTELRPSGNGGPLVTTVQGFLDYQKNEAALWERQALLKARPIAGNDHLAKLLDTQIERLLYADKLSLSNTQLAREIYSMRKKIEKELSLEALDKRDLKKGCGALMDIEFLIQYFQLISAKQYPALQTTSSFDALEALIRYAILDEEDTLILKDAYRFYRNLEAKNGSHLLDKNNEELEAVAWRLYFKSASDLFEQYLIYSKEVRRIFEKELNV